MSGTNLGDNPMGASGTVAERLGATFGAHPLALLLGLGVFAVALLLLLIFGARWMSARGATWRDALLRRTVETHPRAASRGTLARLRRLVRFEYELLHLGLGLACVVAALVFVGLAIAVGGGSAVAAFDLSLARAAHRAASSALVGAMLVVTSLGGADAVIVVGVVVAVVLVLMRRVRLAIAWAVAEAGAGVLNGLLKAIFHRARPTFDDPFTVATGWSFPSGHSMGTIVTAGMLAYVVSRFTKHRAARLGTVFAASVWTLAIGYSRILLGVHWTSDVVAGFAAGAAWVAVCVSAVEVASGPMLRDRAARS